jgi:hypothetical protein
MPAAPAACMHALLLGQPLGLLLLLLPSFTQTL